MREIIFAGILLVSFFVFPSMPFDSKVLLMSIVETLLFLLFGNRRWGILFTFLGLSIVFNWTINHYADLGIPNVMNYLGITGSTTAYFTYMILAKIIVVLLEGIVFGWMTEFDRSLWICLAFINFVSPFVCFLLEHFRVIETVREQIGHFFSKKEEAK